MNHIKKLITPTLIAVSLLAVPAVALAQASPDSPSVEVGTSDIAGAPTTTPTDTPTDTAGVPQTGIAPAPSKLLRNTEVFLIGGSVGGLIGYGVISLKKKSRQDS